MSSTLRKIPPEIREQVFKLTFDEEWTGEMPVIIKALRPDNELYKEAIASFQRMKYTYVLSHRNSWGLGSMSEAVLKTIKKVKISVLPTEDPNLHDDKIHSSYTPSTKFLATCSRLQNLSEAHIYHEPGRSSLIWCIMASKRWTNYLAGLPNLKRVKLTLPTLPTHVPSVETIRTNAVYIGDSKLGTAGKTEWIFVDLAEGEERPNWEREWFWEAEKGELLPKIVM